jgi:hypothetical protein
VHFHVRGPRRRGHPGCPMKLRRLVGQADQGIWCSRRIQSTASESPSRSERGS